MITHSLTELSLRGVHQVATVGPPATAGSFRSVGEYSDTDAGADSL